MLHGDVKGCRHAISRTVSSSSASIQEVPARDGGCRQTSPAIETCALRFIAQGVRPTFGGPPTTVITSNESGAVAETETSCQRRQPRERRPDPRGTSQRRATVVCWLKSRALTNCMKINEINASWQHLHDVPLACCSYPLLRRQNNGMGEDNMQVIQLIVVNSSK